MLWTTEAFSPHHTMLDMLTYPSNSELHQAIIKSLEFWKQVGGKKYLLAVEMFSFVAF